MNKEQSSTPIKEGAHKSNAKKVIIAFILGFIIGLPVGAYGLISILMYGGCSKTISEMV